MKPTRKGEREAQNHKRIKKQQKKQLKKEQHAKGINEECWVHLATPFLKAWELGTCCYFTRVWSGQNCHNNSIPNGFLYHPKLNLSVTK